ncbi:MAG: ABC transporter ATP-binding protein/permease [Bacilli bacterium]|nr:ABC transporter ATP-binding protein/permease [Bacilli bacterium]
MFRHVVRNGFLFGLLIALMIAEPAINSYLNFWLRDLFDLATPETPESLVLRFLIIGFLIWLGKRVITYLASVTRSYIICNVRKNVKGGIFHRLLRLDTNKLFEKEDSGRYLSFFTNDIHILEQKYLSALFSLIGGIFSIVILGASFLTLNWIIGAFIISFGIVSMGVPFFYGNLLNQRNYVYSTFLSRFTLRTKEYLEAYPTVKNYAIEDRIENNFTRSNHDTEMAKFDYDTSLSLSDSVGTMLSWFMQFMAVGLGIMLVIRGQIIIGTVIAARSFSSDLANPLQQIITSMNAIRSVRSVVDNMQRLTEDVSTPESPETITDEGGIGVEYKDFSVTIEGNEIIKGFNFKFEPRKKYLIVGRNGCGKSTLFKALKKRVSGCEGDILVNGHSFNNLSNEELSRHISYLNENVALFSASVRDNVTLFREVSDEQLTEAITAAQMKLPLAREIADGGTNVSSGEQRRIEIARCLIEKIGFIVFDEVISTLDIETAYEIERMILSYEEKTVIFISHNFSGLLLGKYDEILLLEEGRLVAHGPLETIQKNEQFRNILHIKFGDMSVA